MIIIIKKHYPLIIALVLLWITIAVLLVLSVGQNRGHLVYALDDPYIHMAMAKNFVEHGVWGVHQYEFTSATSSPLWVMLLSATYFVFGVSEISPFILNVIFGSLLVCCLYFILRKYTLKPFLTLIVLLAIAFITPLVPLIFCGQEHIMHALLTILFVYLSAKILSGETATFKYYILLLILAPLLTLTRYEGMFLLLVVCALFILRKRVLQSLCLGGMGALSIVIYGMISISKGWYFLPNPILLKGNMPRFSSLKNVIYYFFGNCLEQIISNPHILFLIILALIIFIFLHTRQEGIWKDDKIMIIIFIATTILHMQFVSTGWFYRYEAYLVALGIFVIVIGIHKYLPEKFSLKTLNNSKKLIPKYISIALIIPIVLFPFVKRWGVSLKNTPQATTNIYEQQYQMGLFLKKFYQGECVAVNDIGAINYLADIKCIDLWGLANLEATKFRRDGSYNTQTIFELAAQKKVKIAIVYDNWFKNFGGIPTQWIKVGEWAITNNVVCGGDKVSFYAVEPSEKDNLIVNHLKSFSSHLPGDVVYSSGEY